jgi:ParB-like chromosome segregation protein Spo0J
VPTPTVVNAAAPAPASPDAPGEKRIECWLIADLTPHPDQDQLFTALEGQEFDSFVESMREGLHVPVEVTPDGMIIDGHQRIRAAKELGWTEITAWVREDLAGDDAAINRRHIEANLNRRQLDRLDRARLAKRLMQLERSRGRRTLSDGDRDELRDRVGMQLRLSGRHAERLIKIVSTPMVVQRAYSHQQITIVQAARVAGLGWKKQQQIAQEIEAGGDPTEVVTAHLPQRARRVDLGMAFRRMMSAVQDGLDLFEGKEAAVSNTVHSEFGEIHDLFRRFDGFSHRMNPLLEQQAADLEEIRRKWTREEGDGAGDHDREQDVA